MVTCGGGCWRNFKENGIHVWFPQLQVAIYEKNGVVNEKIAYCNFEGCFLADCRL